ncbi:VOC family protein [Oceanobacillus locisalsi]|uniref:VOC family protein n=1 Tax=Oceanobacillus locisalsi TaxID=546107 RepID=A0ABW3NIW4_9BACI
MHFAFDHIVHFIEDPEKATRTLKNKGIHAVEGGVHQNRPTYNALSHFDLSYIEYLGTSDRQMLEEMEHPQHSMIQTIIKKGFQEGFVRFIIRTDNIEAAAQRFSDKGLTVNGPVYLSREQPDGTLLEWQLLFIGDEKDTLELPYFIQWNESDKERKKALTEKEIIVSHPAEASFSHINIAVNDLERTVDKWSDLLGLETEESYMDEELQATCQKLLLPGGDLVFCSPLTTGVVSEVLEQQGEGPFQVNLSSEQTDDLFEFGGGRYQIKND